MNRIKIGICGLGTVGGGTYKLLNSNGGMIEGRVGVPVAVSHVGARRDNPACPLEGCTVSRDIFAVAEDPDVQILVELIGGTTVARELVERAIANGKHVVTANKALIAEHGNELLKAATAAGVSIRYEAAVAGGIPVIKALREGLSANRVEWLAGIINGTSNFILSEMREKGREFADVLAEAQALGYAEADPTFDVEGVDAAHKLVILAALAFDMPFCFDQVYMEGITRLTPEDVEYAEELGYRIKHLGVARRGEKGVELRVHPTLVPGERLLANVNGVMNAVLIEGDAVGPTLYYGAGAGELPTASAVVADIVDIARDLAGERQPQLFNRAGSEEVGQGRVLPIEEVETAYYLRMEASDRPGVMSQLASLFGEQGISIEALIQKAPKPGATTVPVVMLTDVALEGRLDKAVSAIESLETIVAPVVRIRMENLDG